jgi:hypothetical protein
LVSLAHIRKQAPPSVPRCCFWTTSRFLRQPAFGRLWLNGGARLT